MLERLPRRLRIRMLPHLHTRITIRHLSLRPTRRANPSPKANPNPRRHLRLLLVAIRLPRRKNKSPSPSRHQRGKPYGMEVNRSDARELPEHGM
jgi:hypothetical protein